QQRQDDAMTGRANPLARRGETAPFQAGENGPVDVRHDSWRAHARAGTPCHDAPRLAKMRFCPDDDWGTGPAQRRIGHDLARLVPVNASLPQTLARQNEAGGRRILIEIAQDIGELERPAKMMREAAAFRLRHAKNA